MKILQVIQFFSPKFGGTVTSVYNISKELSKQGYNVTIITTDFEFDKDYAAELTEEGIKLIKFKCILNIASFLYSPSINGWLNKHVHEFDIIHMHNFRTYQNVIVHKHAQKHKVPYVLQAHGSLPLIFGKHGLKRLFDLIWGNNLIKNASNLITVSEIESKQYEQLGVNKKFIKLVSNGVNVEKFEEGSPLNSFKIKHNISTNHMILFVGRLHKIKGLKFLIRAFKRVSEDFSDVTLVIAGPDEGYRAQLENLVCSLKIPNVKFIDFIKNVADAYSSADIVVYPAAYEIFGLVPFEAILCGTPVIVTDNCGCGEIVKKAECGCVVKYGNILELASKIGYLLNNPDTGLKMVENGQNFIKYRLNWVNIVKMIGEVYENSIHNP